MSPANERSGVEFEYEDATKTALAYLQAVGVVEPYEDSTHGYCEPETRIPLDAIMQETGADDLPDDPDADGLSTRKYRERQTADMLAAILGAIQFPNDPFAADAAYLGHRYLHRGFDSRILERLLEKDRTHPAYRKALTIIVHEMRTMGVALPERLQRWERDHERVTGRWNQEATRKYRIGLVVEAMATGSNVLIVCGENERTARQLQVDLKAVREQLGEKSFVERRSGNASEWLQDIERRNDIRNAYVTKSASDIEQLLEILNGMNARPWRHWNEGKGLTAGDLVELTSLPLSEGMGVHGIWTPMEVRKHFPNLYATRNDKTEDQGFFYTICDAVADVLEEVKARRAEKHPRSRSARIGSSYRSVLTDIPQMTSKFSEIVPRPHLQGHSVPIAAIR